MSHDRIQTILKVFDVIMFVWKECFDGLVQLLIVNGMIHFADEKCEHEVK